MIACIEMLSEYTRRCYFELRHFEIKFLMLSQGSVAAVILAANVTTVEQLLSQKV